MDNQYRSKDIFFEIKNFENVYSEFMAQKSRGFIECYKNKCNISLMVQGLESSDVLWNNDKIYRLILVKKLRYGVKEADLGDIIVNARGECEITKKINLNVFERNYGDIWSFNYIGIVTVDKDENMQFIMVADLIEKKEKCGVVEFCEKCRDRDYQEFMPFEEDKIAPKWVKCKRENDLPDIIEQIFDECKYEHFLIGYDSDCYYIAIPGRFMASEQPTFVPDEVPLWLPLKGAGELFEAPDTMSEDIKPYIYGYWIGKISTESESFVSY